MFDSVYATCDCGGSIEWQSKADDCCLAQYSPGSMPPAIARDLEGETAQCRKCGAVYRLGEPPVPRTSLEMKRIG